jgi:hypothetical protein
MWYQRLSVGDSQGSSVGLETVQDKGFLLAYPSIAIGKVEPETLAMFVK